jgi:hypothetical protein
MNSDFVVSSLDAFDERRQIGFPQLNVTLTQARPHQLGECSEFGIVHRREAFPSDFRAL